MDVRKKIKKHDPLVKKFLTDLSAAREFVEIHLPPEIRDKCDLPSIEVVPSLYVEDNLKIHSSDIVYKMNLLHKLRKSNSCVYVYVLVKHIHERNFKHAVALIMQALNIAHTNEFRY